jgi:NADH pyrophosphatase NudC (nudix superfamily)
MKKIVDLKKWNEFVSRLLDDLNMGAYSTGAKHMAYDATKWLEAQPDAEEKHGKWEIDEKESATHVEMIYTCSACRNYDAWGECEKTKYCPNCGAKMDLGEEE